MHQEPLHPVPRDMEVIEQTRKLTVKLPAGHRDGTAPEACTDEGEHGARGRTDLGDLYVVIAG